MNVKMEETSNCGFREAHGLMDDPAETIRAMCEEGDCSECGRSNADSFPECSHVLFTDTVPGGRLQGRGQKLAAFIRAKRLGNVVASAVAENPGSGNNIAGWIWTVNREALEKFLATKEA